MNHRVPGFGEMENVYSMPTTSSRPKKSATGEEIMELLWQNGQVVIQTQNQRASTKRSNGGGEVAVAPEREIRYGGDEQQQQHNNLFMQEDEMASWLQYPIDDSTFDRDLYADLLYSAPPPPPIAAVSQPRVIAEIRSPPPPQPARLQNFVHFSRLPVRPRTEPMLSAATATAMESTVVESSETPMARVSHAAAESRPQVVNLAAAAGDLAAGACDLTVTSSPGGSRASFSGSGEADRAAATTADDRKRKARENDDNECQSEDIEFEATEAKKQARGSVPTKRSRAAEVHNLSERRRRDRINEKMRALQELIPRCNKSDKASMLDEAIEYLKSLQLQVQMMSMGCPMVPMMYPGMQQYMPAMGMGMGMNRPMMPYPSMLQTSPMPNPAHMAAAPRFPMPAPFHMPPQVHIPHDPSRIQVSSQTDPVANFSQYQNQPRMPNLVDPYQQYLGMHQGQLLMPHNQAMVQPGANKPSTNKETGNPHDNQQLG